MVLSLVGAMVGTGLFAHFTDTETSVGNTFTAGIIDLEVDVDDVYYNGVPFPMFSVHPDIKPCFEDEVTLSLHLTEDSNDADILLSLNVTEDDDNGIVEPEADAGDQSDGAGMGELDDFIWIKIWWDEGILPGWQGKTVDPWEGNNIQDEEVDDNGLDGEPGTGDLGEDDGIQADEGFIYEGYASGMVSEINCGRCVACTTYYLGFYMHFEQLTDVNLAMSDSWGFNAVVTASQIMQ
jgi:predicted ribosomally synthesized peptide with SipW-like signal peptide